MRLSLEDTGIKPVKIDKRGPLYDKEDLLNTTVRLIQTECYFKHGAKEMTKDANDAIAITEKVTQGFEVSLNRFSAVQKDFVNNCKKTSGDVRDAANKLSEGLARIEKAANFDRLERYVVLLERASVAMGALAELEKSGRLEKIAAALK